MYTSEVLSAQSAASASTVITVATPGRSSAAIHWIHACVMNAGTGSTAGTVDCTDGEGLLSLIWPAAAGAVSEHDWVFDPPLRLNSTGSSVTLTLGMLASGGATVSATSGILNLAAGVSLTSR